MIKQIFYTSLFLIASMLCTAQEIEPKWLKLFGGHGSDEIYSAAMDNAGNLYITGYFQDEITFDNVTLKSFGTSDIFLAKFDSDGRLLWAKNAGGNYSENLIIPEFAKKIKIDKDGNIIIAGCFMWQAFFDSISLIGKGYMDIFVAKFNTAGKLIWVKSFGGKEHDFFYDMDILGDQIFITGILTGPELQKSASISTISEDGNPSSSRTFIAGLDRNGELLWWKRDTLQAQKNLIKAFDNKLYYAKGLYSRNLHGENPQARSVDTNIAIQKISPTGSIEWNKSIASETNRIIEAFDVSSDGSLILIGKNQRKKDLMATSTRDNLSAKYFYCSINPTMDLTLKEIHSGTSSETPTFNKNTKSSVKDKHIQSFTISYDSEININDAFRTKLLFARTEALDGLNDLQPISYKIRTITQLNNEDVLIAGNCISTDNTIGGRISNQQSMNIFIARSKISEFANKTEYANIKDLDESITLSPNPANYYCNIFSESSLIADYLEIINPEGKIMQTYSQFSLPGKIYFKDFSSETYVIKLRIGNTTIHKKLIITKD